MTKVGKQQIETIQKVEKIDIIKFHWEIGETDKQTEKRKERVNTECLTNGADRLMFTCILIRDKDKTQKERTNEKYKKKTCCGEIFFKAFVEGF